MPPPPPPPPGEKAAAFVEGEEEDPEEDPEELDEEEDEEFVEEEVEEAEEEVEEIEEEFYEIVQVSEDEEVDEVEIQEEEEDPDEEEEESWENLPAAAVKAFEVKDAGNCIEPVKEDADKAGEETPAEEKSWENLPAAAAAEEEALAVNCIQPMKEDARKVEEKARSSSFVLQSVSDLQILQGAISEFVRGWNELQSTFDFIQSSIDRRSKELDAVQRPSHSLSTKELVVKEEDQGPADKRPSGAIDELVFICKAMDGKDLRKYIIKHIDEIDRLRRELPAAIRSAPDPAEVVFLSVGRFYMQGRKCYENPKAPEVNIRRALILLLEIFILSGCVSELNPSLKEEALVTVKDWMGRIVHEGGARSATAKDALTLVLFMASFGIPPKFRSVDLYDLLHLCNLRKEAHVLRLSPFLLAKLPDIIKEIIGKDMHVEAVNLICSFGLEEKFPPLPLLSLLCNKSSGIVGDGQRSKRSLIDGNKKHLATLKSVVKCLKENKLDSSLLEGIELSEGIAKTEKKILELEQEQKKQNGNLKRVAEEGAVSEAKRPRPASVQASLKTPPRSSKQAQDQGGAAPIGSRGFHLQNLFGGVYTGRHNGDVMRAAAGSEAVPSPTAVCHRQVPSSANGDGKGSSASSLYHFADNVP